MAEAPLAPTRYDGYHQGDAERDAHDSLAARVERHRHSSVDGDLASPVEWCNGLCQRWLIVLMGLVLVGIFLGLVVGVSAGSREHPRCTPRCCSAFCCLMCADCSASPLIQPYCNRSSHLLALT
jgi:hypothetical protein